MSAIKKAAIIGHPVGHSKSPLIHRYWLEKYNFNGTFEAIDIAPDRLEDEIQTLITNAGYCGFNFTLPHKEKVFALCDEVDKAARNIEAVNAVRIENGRMHGTNTDAFGFTENIKHSAPGFDFTAGPAVVLGAGGAAKAVVYGLRKENVPEIRVLNRTRSRAEDLAKGRVKALDWEMRDNALTGANLLVNTTALGMTGQPPLDINLDALPAHALVTDIVYVPLETVLLKQAKARGHQAVGGLGMLLHQARPVFKTLFGIMPEIDQALIDKVLK